MLFWLYEKLPNVTKQRRLAIAGVEGFLVHHKQFFIVPPGGLGLGREEDCPDIRRHTRLVVWSLAVDIA